MPIFSGPIISICSTLRRWDSVLTGQPQSQ